MLEWLNCVFFCFCTNCPYRPILSVGSHCISNWAQKRNVLVCTWHLGKRFKQGLLFSSIYVFSNMSSTHFLCGDLFHALRRPTVTAYLLMLIVRPPSKKQTLVTKRGDQYANRMHVCVCLGKVSSTLVFRVSPKTPPHLVPSPRGLYTQRQNSGYPIFFLWNELWRKIL